MYNYICAKLYICTEIIYTYVDKCRYIDMYMCIYSVRLWQSEILFCEFYTDHFNAREIYHVIYVIHIKGKLLISFLNPKF